MKNIARSPELSVSIDDLIVILRGMLLHQLHATNFHSIFYEFELLQLYIQVYDWREVFIPV